jgi:isoquinoline 1-oxidoreductase beta subunit
LGGIAVIASNTWSAQQGRQRLEIEWDYGTNAGHDSTAYRAELEATAREPGAVVRNHGDVDNALASAARSVSADYFVPYLAHAQMEKPNAVAHWLGGACEIWSPTQNPTQVRQTVAQVLGISETDVTVNVTLLCGGFGRKSKPDYVAEAALLSRMISAPIKVTWTREDDIRHDYYHAICAQHLEAALDQDGRANAWLHRTVSPPIEATSQPNVVYDSGGELGQGVIDIPYYTPNVRCENGTAANHVRIGWYRSVYNIPHAFAVCSFAGLNTDYIDTYQVHWPDPLVPIEETAEAMQTLFDQGKIRAIGVSNFCVAQIERFRSVAKLGGTSCNRPTICSSARSTRSCCPIACSQVSRP